MEKKNLYPSSDPNVEASGIVKDDPKRIEAYDLFFGKNSIINNFFDAEVEDDFVKECVGSYRHEFKDKSDMKVEDIKKAYTTYASFGNPLLVNWIIKMNDNTDTTDYRLYLGMYSKKAGEILSGDDSVNSKDRKAVKDKEGRVTILIRPFCGENPAKYNKGEKNGALAKSFNLGSIHP
jgi:hypothetical protein